MARLYANENFPQPAVQELRRLGHDVLTVLETGRASQAWSDADVFKFACTERRAILTMNRRHLVRLHQQDPSHPGMVLCTFDPDFVAQAKRIHDALERQIDLAGQILRVNRPS